MIYIHTFSVKAQKNINILYTHTEICISADTESPSQPAVTWHIISHTRKDGPPTETVEITKCPYGKR